ncbi:unnamed protein product [Paramecium octaurelia]|uniref:Transmembrane protein n=1 Tax=Paramecium octaurelia TaxID=43137 RepID=A0A8S1Y2W8_PAROT|nr:unnamed protein product [Paramecium octaurelia]
MEYRCQNPFFKLQQLLNFSQIELIYTLKYENKNAEKKLQAGKLDLLIWQLRPMIQQSFIRFKDIITIAVTYWDKQKNQNTEKELVKDIINKWKRIMLKIEGILDKCNYQLKICSILFIKITFLPIFNMVKRSLQALLQYLKRDYNLIQLLFYKMMLLSNQMRLWGKFLLILIIFFKLLKENYNVKFDKIVKVIRTFFTNFRKLTQLFQKLCINQHQLLKRMQMKQSQNFKRQKQSIQQFIVKQNYIVFQYLQSIYDITLSKYSKLKDEKLCYLFDAQLKQVVICQMVSFFLLTK